MAPSSGSGRARWSGAPAHRTGTPVPGAARHRAPPRAWTRCSGYPDRRVPLASESVPPCSRSRSSLAGCSGGAAASFDPTGPCTTDGQRPGAYPDLEARIPTDAAGRRADQGGLRPALHQRGPRLARGGRLQGDPVRRRNLVVRCRTVGGAGGLHRARPDRRRHGRVLPRRGERRRADGPARGDRGHARRPARVIASTPRPASGCRRSRSGRRPSADTVNVVITNDLPDARIADAVDAFGGR